MNTIPKRRWQFSLRWLIIVMIVGGILFSRVAYFRQRALFHEHETARYESMIPEDNRLMMDDAMPRIRAYEHRYLAHRNRRAMYRPLTPIFEPTAPWQRSKEAGNWCLNSRF